MALFLKSSPHSWLCTLDPSAFLGGETMTGKERRKECPQNQPPMKEQRRKFIRISAGRKFRPSKEMEVMTVPLNRTRVTGKCFWKEPVFPIECVLKVLWVDSSSPTTEPDQHQEQEEWSPSVHKIMKNTTLTCFVTLGKNLISLCFGFPICEMDITVTIS